MEKTLSFTDTSSQTVKIGDTTTSFTLVCGNDNTAVDLTHATSITVKLGNASGYLKSTKIEPSKLTDPTNGKITVTFDADLMKSLPAGNCAIEVWVVDSTGTSIYPSDGSTGFTITNNIQSTTGEVITTIAFDEFVEAMKKAASTIAKGDKGEKGDTGTVDNGGLIKAPAFVELQTQVNDSAVGTNLLINTSSSATNGKTTFPGGTPAILGTYSRTDSYEQITSPSSGECFYRFTLNSISNNLWGLVAGETYTISGQAVINEGTLSFRSLATDHPNGWHNFFGDGLYDLKATNSDGVTFTPFSYTFTVPVDATGIFLSLRADKYTKNTVLRFKKMKLEKGSVATDWCPNPSEILTQSDYAKLQAAIVSLGGHLS